MNKNYRYEEDKINITGDVLLKEFVKYLKYMIVVIVVFTLLFGGFAKIKNKKNNSYSMTTSLRFNPRTESIMEDKTSFTDVTRILNDYVIIVGSQSFQKRVAKTAGIDENLVLDKISSEVDANGTFIFNVTANAGEQNVNNRILKATIKELNKEIKNDNVVKNIMVVEEAKEVADSGISVKKYAVVGGLLGIVISVLAFLIKFFLDFSIRSNDEAEYYLQVPVLGDTKLNNIEDYRSIRTNLLSMQTPTQIMTVVSGVKDEEANQAGTALAQSFAHIEETILELRLTKNASSNLSDVIGKVENSKEFYNLIEAKIDNIELLDMQKFEIYIKELSNKYDRIIISSPACKNSSAYLSLAKISDGVIYVIGPKDHRKKAELVVESIHRINKTVIGSILLKK